MRISLQLGRAEVFTQQAAANHGLDVRVVSSRWLGRRCRTARGDAHFRVAEVVERVPDAWYPQDDHKPEKSEGAGWIEAARWIKSHHQARRVVPETGELVPEKKRGGILLDAFSAGRMAAVYDVLNEQNRAKFNKMNVRVAHHIAFEVGK